MIAQDAVSITRTSLDDRLGDNGLVTSFGVALLGSPIASGHLGQPGQLRLTSSEDFAR